MRNDKNLFTKLARALSKTLGHSRSFIFAICILVKITKNRPPHNHRESAIWRFRLVANQIIIENRPPMINQNRPFGGFISLRIA